MRVIAYCFRFYKNCRQEPTRNGCLTVKELNNALRQIIKITQLIDFKLEIETLKHNKQLEATNKINNLSPFLDADGVLRVGGRLQNSMLPYNEKHPMILSSTSHLTRLIIWNAHQNTLHGGNQITLAYTRRKFWIINGKKTVRNIINKCIKCIRFKAQTSEQQMGELPLSRVTLSHPFLHTGVDYAGPLQIRATKGRGHKSYKGYIAIFVCLSTKAIHIEVVSDMTSDSFLAAFRRFTARRGPVAHMYSDNGTTFVGASKDLAEINSLIRNQDLQNSMVTMGTQWHFIPPNSPNFGGLWEAGVKSLKHHLKRIIGNSTLTY